MKNVQERQNKDQRLTKNIKKGILIAKYLHTINSIYKNLGGKVSLMDLTKISRKTFWFFSASHLNWFEMDLRFFLWGFFCGKVFQSINKGQIVTHCQYFTHFFHSLLCLRAHWYTSGISVLSVHAHTPINRLSWRRHWNSSALSLRKRLMWRNYCTPEAVGRAQKALFLTLLCWALLFPSLWVLAAGFHHQNGLSCLLLHLRFDFSHKEAFSLCLRPESMHTDRKGVVSLLFVLFN